MYRLPALGAAIAGDLPEPRTLWASWREMAPPAGGPRLPISVGGNIIGEATIGFLGFGVPPPNPTWGGMLSREAYRYMLQNPWIAVWPGPALAVVMFGTNVFGDALRDLVDPKLRGGVGRFAVPKKQRHAARG